MAFWKILMGSGHLARILAHSVPFLPLSTTAHLLVVWLLAQRSSPPSSKNFQPFLPGATLILSVGFQTTTWLSSIALYTVGIILCGLLINVCLPLEMRGLKEGKDPGCFHLVLLESLHIIISQRLTFLKDRGPDSITRQQSRT